jgi:hypothetical protein
MTRPHSHESSIRVHDEAVSDWLGNLRVDYGTVLGEPRNNLPIIRVFAAPERAYSAVVDTLVRTGWIPGATDAERRANAGEIPVLPLPLVTIERKDLLPELDIANVPFHFRKREFDLETQMWVTHPHPGSWRQNYTLTFWAHKQYTMAFCQEWILSQLGARRGHIQAETMIPVNHRAPWGVINQQFRWEGFSDQSEIPAQGEFSGADQRWIRLSADFSLRFLFFHKASASHRPIVHIEWYECSPTFADAITMDPGVCTLWTQQVSSNLFRIDMQPRRIPTLWPTLGDATVQAGTWSPNGVSVNGLRFGLLTPADEADVNSRSLSLDDHGRAILSVSYEYLTDAAFALNVAQRSGASPVVWTNADRFVGEPGFERSGSLRWQRVHFFALLTQPIYDISVWGLGEPGGVRSDTHVHDVDIRHVRSYAPTPPDGSIVYADFTKYNWVGLDSHGYLVVVERAPTGGVGAINVQAGIAEAELVGQVVRTIYVDARSSTASTAVDVRIAVVVADADLEADESSVDASGSFTVDAGVFVQAGTVVVDADGLVTGDPDYVWAVAQDGDVDGSGVLVHQATASLTADPSTVDIEGAHGPDGDVSTQPEDSTSEGISTLVHQVDATVQADSSTVDVSDAVMGGASVQPSDASVLVLGSVLPLGSISSLDTIVVQNDISTPTLTQTKRFDDARRTGVVILMQPMFASISALIPSRIPVAAVYLHRYDGAYRGTDVPSRVDARAESALVDLRGQVIRDAEANDTHAQAQPSTVEMAVQVVHHGGLSTVVLPSFVSVRGDVV